MKCLNLRRSVIELFGTCAVVLASFAAVNEAKADQGGVSFWIPGFFGAHGVEFPPAPSVQDDPVVAWETVRATIAGALSDPDLASRPVETPFSTQSLADTVDMIVTGDVFTHTWDLARATGPDRLFMQQPVDDQSAVSDGLGPRRRRFRSWRLRPKSLIGCFTGIRASRTRIGAVAQSRRSPRPVGG